MRSDSELAEKARRGDAEALEAILRRHHDFIYSVCWRILRNDNEANDACQDALWRIAKSIARFEGQSKFSTWAYRIAANSALTHLSKMKALEEKIRMAVQDGNFDTHVRDHADEVADEFDFEAVLGKLPDELRATLVLRATAGLDYKEIADELKIPIGTVKSRLARARALLAEHFGVEQITANKMVVKEVEVTDG